MEERPLSGYRFAVIEDEIPQALQLAAMLEEMGGAVAVTAYSYEQALKALDGADFDCALLDINLAGTLSFPIADRLRERRIPFIFCTAYADAASVYVYAAEAPRLDKPVSAIELRDNLIALLLPKRSSRKFL